jgi:hypothetical protein
MWWCLFIIECILGHYGYNCEESCDGCLLDSCERENGVCTDTNGCKPGRKPGQLMKCDIGMQIIFYFCLIYIKVTYGFSSFPDVNWFCLFIYLCVLTSPWKIVQSSVILLLPLLTIINNWSLTINTIAIHKSDKHQGTQYHSITFLTNVYFLTILRYIKIHIIDNMHKTLWFCIMWIGYIWK